MDGDFPGDPFERKEVFVKGFWLSAAIAAAIDLASKAWVFAWLRDVPLQVHDFVPGWFRFVLHINQGALWGVGSGTPLLLLLMTAVIIPVVIVMALSCKEKSAPLWSLGLVLGGAAGNFYDRLFTAESVLYAEKPVAGVRDFIHMSWPGVYSWPVYNVADVAIVVGVGVFVLWNLVCAPKSAPAASADAAAPEAAPAAAPEDGKPEDAKPC